MGEVRTVESFQKVYKIYITFLTFHILLLINKHIGIWKSLEVNFVIKLMFFKYIYLPSVSVTVLLYYVCVTAYGFAYVNNSSKYVRTNVSMLYMYVRIYVYTYMCFYVMCCMFVMFSHIVVAQ